MSDAEGSASTRPRMQRVNTTLAILSALIATGVTMYLVLGGQAHFNDVSDTPEYIISAKLLVSGHAERVYDEQAVRQARGQMFPQLRQRGVAVFSPPPALVLLSPFALLPTNVSAELFWMPAQLLLIIAGCVFLQKTQPLPARLWPWFWCWLMLFGPTFECLRIGQITPLLFFALAAFEYGFLRTESGGVGGGALAAFILKPQEAATWGAYLLGARRWKTLMAAGVAALVLCVIAFMWVGMAGYSAFFHMLRHLGEQAKYMMPEMTPTIRGEAMRLFGTDSPIVAPLSLVAVGAALVVSLWLGTSEGTGRKLKALAIMPLGLLTAMLCHTYDLLLVAPTVYRLFGMLPALQPRARNVGIGTLALFSLPFWLPLYVEINYGPIRQTPLNPFFWALSILVAGTLCLALQADKQQTP